MKTVGPLVRALSESTGARKLAAFDGRPDRAGGRCESLRER
jgi:hypothetical protein